MARRKKNGIELPSPSDDASISQTTIYPTIDAMFAGSIAKLQHPDADKPWFEEYSRATRRTMRFVFYTAVAETQRLIAFRVNADQDFSVMDELQKELNAFSDELKRGDDMRAAAILGLPS